MASRSPLCVWPFFAFLLIPFTCVFPYVAACNNPNENVRVYLTMAIVEQRSFQIDTMVDRYGWVNDMAAVPARDGHGTRYFSLKGPAVSWAGVPFYWVFSKLAPHFGHPRPGQDSADQAKRWWQRSATFVMRLCVVQLPCFTFLIWFERWLRKSTPDVVIRLSCVAAMALGTNYLAYALMFTSHALSAAVAFLAFGLISEELTAGPRASPRPLARAALLGWLTSLVTMLEYQGLILSVALAIYAVAVLRRPREVLAFAGGGAVNTALVMIYQWRCFGNPFTPGHKLAETEAFAEWHRQGLYGVGAPSWEVLRDLSIHQTFGFFTTSRFLGLAGLAIPYLLVTLLRDRSRRGLLVATVAWVAMMLVFFVVMSGAVNWRGGWTVGPRLLGAAPPFFTFGAACGLEAFARRGPRARTLSRGLAGGFAVAGVCTLGLVSLVYNSVPEEIAHPLAEFALPLARAGFVPYHAGQLFGWMSPTFFYVAFGCGVGAAVVAAAWPAGDRARTVAVRGAIAIVVLASCMFAEFIGDQEGQPGPQSVALGNFVRAWEPPNRDFVSSLRAKAAFDGDRDPCLWYALADRERGLGLLDEADSDRRRASVPASACR